MSNSKLFNILFGIGLCMVVWFGWEMWPSSTPTEHGKEIVLMMKYDKGWRLGKNQNCIVHEKANLVVEPGKVWARVRRWDDPSIVYDLNWTDCKQINTAFSDASKNITKAKAEEPLIVGENAKQLVESMLSGEGWEVLQSKDNEINGLFAREADICVYSDGSVWLFASSVWVWDEVSGKGGRKPVRDTKAFSKMEQRYIADNYRAAQEIIIKASVK